MCVIIACRDKFPDLETLEQAEEHNKDGGGVAWVEDNKVKFLKGLNSATINRMIKKEKLTLPCIIHFRICTVGGVCDELTHPFPINKTASTKINGKVDSVLFHNGSYNNWDELLLKTVTNQGLKIPKGKWSDSSPS